MEVEKITRNRKKKLKIFSPPTFGIEMSMPILGPCCWMILQKFCTCTLLLSTKRTAHFLSGTGVRHGLPVAVLPQSAFGVTISLQKQAN